MIALILSCSILLPTLREAANKLWRMSLKMSWQSRRGELVNQSPGVWAGRAAGARERHQDSSYSFLQAPNMQRLISPWLFGSDGFPDTQDLYTYCPPFEDCRNTWFHWNTQIPKVCCFNCIITWIVFGMGWGALPLKSFSMSSFRRREITVQSSFCKTLHIHLSQVYEISLHLGFQFSPLRNSDSSKFVSLKPCS